MTIGRDALAIAWSSIARDIATSVRLRSRRERPSCGTEPKMDAWALRCWDRARSSAAGTDIPPRRSSTACDSVSISCSEYSR